MGNEYRVHRCKSCKEQVEWSQRDRLSCGWFHGNRDCAFGQYLNPDDVETITVVLDRGYQ